MKLQLFSFAALWPILLGASLGALVGYFGQCTSGACPLTSTWWRGALYGALLAFLFTANTRPADRRAPRQEPLPPGQKPSPSNPEGTA